jgi:hypothetical protein
MLSASAWLPYSDILTPAKTVAELQAAGITTAVLMVNDFSTARGPTSFRHWEAAKLVAMADACRDAEIIVWLCSWVMPHRVFIEGAIAQLPALMQATGAELILWDAEEPWTQATGVFDRGDACERLVQAFGLAKMGVTAIGSAPSEVVPLADVCAVRVPQCYATDDSKARPSEVVTYGVRRWREQYGEPHAAGRYVIGLAGYDQAADCGVTMWPPIDDVLAGEFSEVIYWTNNAIAARPDVASFVRGLSQPLPPHPGVMPLVNLATMPSGVAVPVVKQIQTLLTAWGVDPGPVDGKPGPRTVAGVQTFQRRKGLAPTGLVDALTWSELLRP